MKKLLMSASFILAAGLSNIASADKECISIYELPNGENSTRDQYIAVCTEHCAKKNMKYSAYNTHGKDCPPDLTPGFDCFCQ